MALASNISLSFSHTTRALLRLEAPAQRQGGLDAETLRGFQLAGV